MAKATGPVIIEAVINGVTTREQNPRVPISPEGDRASA